MNNLPILYDKEFIQNPNELFDSLWNELDWVNVAGPRLEYYTHDLNIPYTYGTNPQFARTYNPQIKHPVIQYIQNLIEEFHNCKFEVCFINGYRDSKDQLGWHRDYSDDSRPIVIISLGAEREIYFRETPTLENKSTPVHKLLLGNGSLCSMLPGMQNMYQHRIPKCDKQDCGKRISLTFRGYK